MNVIKPIILLGTFLMLGCSDNNKVEEPINPDPEEEVVESKYLKLHQVYRNGNLNNTFEYDSIHRIKSNSYQIGVYSYTYSEDTTYSKLTLHEGGVINSSKRFHIDENSIRHNFFDGKGELDYYHIYEYNENQCGYSIKQWYDEKGNFTASSTVEYIDSNCSSIERFMDSEGQLFKKITLLKSDNFSHLNSIREIPRMFDFEYAWVSRMEEDGQGNIDSGGSFNQINEYNDENYLAKTSVTSLNGFLTEYEYYYH